jgi:hypothetical protein
VIWGADKKMSINAKEKGRKKKDEGKLNLKGLSSEK